MAARAGERETLAMRVTNALVAIAALTAVVMGCTTTQKAVSGGALGGVAGLAVAGPIGAVAGATAGAVTAPMIRSD
jgi:osmotically inducible lipoprotein OsmB